MSKMVLPNVMHTGRSGMTAAKAAISTAGHNIANANTEGYSRQRVQQASEAPYGAAGSKTLIGHGARIARVERLNDQYIEKQIRNNGRDLANNEEKDIVLKQAEDVFNEMGGEGLNRVMSRFFNEFRKLANEPENEGVRQAVRESSQSLVNDFRRLRSGIEDITRHADARIESHVGEMNAIAEEIKDLNVRIKAMELGGASANDLGDKRDLLLKKLSTYADLSMHQDSGGGYIIDVKGVGPLVVGGQTEKFSVQRSPANDEGKPEGGFDIISSSNVRGNVTHQLKSGKLGALVEARDQVLGTMLSRLDELAFQVSQSVNEIHRSGFTRTGFQGVDYFKPLQQKQGAAEFFDLSDAVQASANNIAAAATPDSPGDNRVAIAISGIQNHQLMNDGQTSVDDFYNSIVSEVGVAAAKNRSSLVQHKDIMNQLGKMREQISGVSIDEETTNLMQYQHAFDASAKVIQIADELMKTVLSLRG